MSAYYNEIDPYAAQWLRNLIEAGYIAPGVVDERDIRDILPTDLDGFTQCHFFAGIGVWPAAIGQALIGSRARYERQDKYLRRAAEAAAGWRGWTGSCPCQPFSAAGKGAGFADERHLWPAWFHLISARRPGNIFGEQVASKDGYAWLDLVQTDLESLAYSTGAVVFPAAGVGAPHIRHRTYFVADSNCKGLAQRECDRRVQQEALGSLQGQAAECGSDVGRLADPLQSERGRRSGLDESEPDRQTPRWVEGDGGAGIDCEVVTLAHDDRSGLSLERGARLRRSELHDADGCSADGRPSPTNGFWGIPDWLYCRDEPIHKWRPVEPGTFPLAHGTAARVGRLRAYGNAICLPQAQAFIEAYLGTST